MKSVYKKYANCIGVKGFTKGIIYDLQRNKYYNVPNSLIDFLEIIDRYETISQNQQFFDFCLENEIIFKCNVDDAIKFIPLDLKWQYPYKIISLVVDFNCIDFFSNTVLIPHTLCIIFSEFVTEKTIADKMDIIRQLNPNNIIYCFNYDIPDFFIKKICEQDLRVNQIFIYNSSSKIVYNEDTHHCLIIKYEDDLNSISSKVNVSVDNFYVNLPLFSEAQTFHTYYNRRLYIDYDGNVKNSFESSYVHSNINLLSNTKELLAAVDSAQFKSIWNVKKDNCDICKDCEFRYMCVDNRLPFKKNENEWYHKTECNYNPYICKWQGEEGYLTLQDCGIRSDETGFYIDHDKIAAINRELWGDDE